MPAAIAGIASAVIGAGSSIYGDMSARSGANQANQMNMAEIQQEEGWMANMSNTAMQRRVADLQAAGLNPMLAIGQGGASTPGIGQLAMQNPNQAFGQFGQQMQGAVQTGVNTAQSVSQIELRNAQAAQANAQAHQSQVTADKAAGVDTDVGRQNIAESQSRIALNQLEGQKNIAQARLSNAQVQVAEAQLPQIQADIKRAGAATNLMEHQAALADAASRLQNLNGDQVAWLMPSLAQSAANAAKSSTFQLPEGQARSDFWQSSLGKASPYLEKLSGFIGAAFAGLRAIGQVP